MIANIPATLRQFSAGFGVLAQPRWASQMQLFQTLVQTLAIAALTVACAKAAEVELDYRLQPERDLTTELVTEAVTTFRVLEDRGIVAKSNGRLSSQPTTVHIIDRQSLRYITGRAEQDGRFPVEMLYLEKTMHMKGADGLEHQLPNKTPLKGVRVAATVEVGGKVSEGTVQVTGVEASLAQPMRQTMAAAITQAAAIEPILLSQGRSVPQEIAMQLPIAGITTLELKTHISNQLLGVEGGVARIQQIYSMNFGTPAGAIKMSAEGSGGGTLQYEVLTKTLLSSESGTLMKFILDTHEGVVEMQMNSKQSQKMRPTHVPVR